MPFIVMTGMHWAFVPACLLGLADPGFDLLLLPAMLCSNTAQAGATFGVAFKTKDKEMRQMAIPAGISALLAGVTESAMYGITLKLRKPMIAACIASGVSGLICGIVQLKAYAFASGILGEGYAVIPSEGKVYAPFDGLCENLFDTLHALGLTSDQGVEMLIHVGLETVTLNGAPFTAHIKSGDRFKKGDLLLEFNIEEIQKAGCEIQTPVLITNAEELGGVTVEDNKLIIGGE